MGPDTILCRGDILKTYNFNGGRSYLWHDGSVEPWHIIDTSGIYWVEVTYGDNCIYRDSAYIDVVSNALIDLGKDIYVCEPNTEAIIDADIKTELSGFSINWLPKTGIDDPTSSSIIISNDTSQRYIMELISPNGCIARDTIEYIIIKEYKPEIYRDGHYLVSSSKNNNQWYLDDKPIVGGTQQRYLPLATGIYTLKVVDKYGCESLVSTPVYFSETEYDTPILSIADVDGKPGETVNIKLFLSNSVDLLKLNIEEIDVSIEYNSTLLYPNDITTAIIDSVTSSVTITGINVNNKPSEPIFSFNCTVGLGNAPDCILKISDVITIDANADIGLIHGNFKLLNICQEGGTRLINPLGEQSGIIDMFPNPANNKINIKINLIEEGRTELLIFNSIGEIVETILSEDVNQYNTREYNTNISNLSSGLYFIVFKTKTYRQTEQLMIIR